MSAICVDSVFLLGLYDDRDQYHVRARELFIEYFGNRVNRMLVPSPVLYETVSTRLARHPESLAVLDRDWRRLLRHRQLILLDDTPYRQAAINECLDELRAQTRRLRPLSLTDRVIRSMLDESRIRVDLLITFNVADFADICRRVRLPLVL